MAAQAENEHPLGFKRRQSKAFQGLLQKEPVTKSPFKQPPPAEPEPEEIPPPPPPKLSRLPPLSASPGRSSLVSKRLHGPRNAGNGSLNGRRQRRKTVTFDERCDVVEFDVEEDEVEEDPFDSQDDYSDEGSEDADSDDDADATEQPPAPEESYDSSQVGNDSITGLVESMLHDSDPKTPPHNMRSLPPDTETEDGVPYGRTHHADRLSAAHRHATDGVALTSDCAISTIPSTPPQSRPATPDMASAPGSRIRGRASLLEQAQKGIDVELDDDMRMLPPSPSPAKVVSTLPNAREGLVPKFALDTAAVERDNSRSKEDPFDLPQVKDEPVTPDLSFVSEDTALEIRVDPANLSIGNSEVSLDGLDRGGDRSGGEEPERHVNEHASSVLSSSSASQANAAGAAKPDGCSSRPSTPLQQSESSPVSSVSAFRFTPPVALSRRTPPKPSSNGGILVPNSVWPVGFVVAEQGGSPFRRSLDLKPATGVRSSNGSLRTTEALVEQHRAESPLRRRADEEAMDVVHETRDVANVSHDTEPADCESKHTPDNPLGDFRTHVGRSGALPIMSRQNNYTHDGVMSIDPEPQEIDPPRPSMITRANTTKGDPQYAFQSLRLDFEDDFVASGSGMPMDTDPEPDQRNDVHLGDVSALDRLMENVANGANGNGDGRPFNRLRVDGTTEVVHAFQFGPPADAEDGKDEPTDNESEEEAITGPMSRLAFHTRSRSEPVPGGSGHTNESPPPVPPPKDAIRAREELIKTKKREARRKEEQEVLGYSVPSRVQEMAVGRPSRRRSMSTGDAEGMVMRRAGVGPRRATARSSGLLDLLPIDGGDDPLADSINRELKKLEGSSRTKYHVRERPETIYATADTDRMSHANPAGDADGKAWRTVKRPSDMNEFATQIKELYAQEKSGKAYGKVFVKVLGVKGISVPLPQQPTAISCTLNNGIHFVTTPDCRLGRECRIDQEFELIEHSKLEFTLTIKVRRDPHIVAQFKENTAPPPPPPIRVHVAPPPASKGGMRNFFRGSPKKPVKAITAPVAAAPPAEHKLVENLARYLKPDGTLARAFISFRDIAHRCDTKLFETSYPLIGQRAEARAVSKTVQVGEIVLQIFRLPPLPGILPNQLPQSLEECHRGLRHTSWHKVTYFEGTLTQNGGDCMSWRRRHFRLMGGNLVAYNDVTKRVTATIDLKKATAVQDDQDVRSSMLSPASGVSGRSRHVDEFDGPYGAERAFRLLFHRNQEIVFFADTDEEKGKWLEVLRALVGRIPPNPLWGELVWQRQQELVKQAAAVKPHAARDNPLPLPNR